ncbi:hypothetical protein CTEN210_04455 [Chaetoceros tenuissimus]|uniref:Actin-related protein 10 n=1 Tax=Chaetoceros tenuissimus TaxID=426638 RepID=A0AAD3CLP1_9STRA|nr:hypothetical protein CTEN210_04455 [Chaetoceros tenuissimus]
MAARASSYRKSFSSNLDIASSQSTPLVFEFGSALLRVGIAGETTPRHIFPLRSIQNDNNDESPKDESDFYWSSSPALPADKFFSTGVGLGCDTEEDEKTFQILNPWLRNLYIHSLLLKPRSRKVIVILPIFHHPLLRSTLESIFLNELKVPSILFTDSFETIPYVISTESNLLGQAEGSILIDMGRMDCRVACVFNGRMIENTLQIVPIMNQIKDAKEEDEAKIVQEMYFDLTNPQSLVFAFLSCLEMCPIDLRRVLVQKVVFVGGGVESISSLEKRFVRCIQSLFELESDSQKYIICDSQFSRFRPLASPIMRGPMKVLYPLPFRPSMLSFLGASIMGSIKMPDEAWIHRES